MPAGPFGFAQGRPPALLNAACFLLLVLSFRRCREGSERVKRDWKRKNSNSVEGLRLPHPGSVDGRDCGNGSAHRGTDCGADSAAHDEKQVLRAAFAARGQEVAGAV